MPEVEQFYPQLLTENFTRKKPKGWARTSYASYYKPDYAKWVKANLDLLVSSPIDTNTGLKTLVLAYEDFPQLSSITLYHRVNQGLAYLCREMDDANGTYKTLRTKISIRQNRKIGLVITFAESNGTMPLGNIVVGTPKVPKWKIDLQNFVESEAIPQRPFIRQGLSLTVDEVKQVYAEYGDLTNIVLKVSQNEIRCLRMS